MDNDLISREDLKKAIIEPLNVNDAGKNDWYDGYYTAKNEDVMAIDNAPTVPLPDFKEGYKQAIIDGKTNFSRPQGEWINHRNDYGHNIADCSLCGKAMQWHDEDEDGIPRYCWYCGAEMQKGGAE